MPIAASAPWTLTVRVNAVDVSGSLTGEVHIDIDGGAARTATIEIDVSGVINPTDYVGKALEIDVNYEAQTVRLFTGRIDKPRAQSFVNALTLLCSDAKSATANSLTRAQLDVVTGHVPNAVFVGDDATGTEYVEAAMAETLNTLELDAAGAWRLVPLAAKVVADWFYDGGDILDGSFVVDFGLADELKNDVTVEVTAQRARFWNRRAVVNWHWQQTFVEYLARSRELPNRPMFDSAVSQLGWYVYPNSDSAYQYLETTGLFYSDTGARVPAGTVVSGATPTTAFKNPFTELLTSASANIETWWTQRVNLAASVRLQAPTSIAAHGAHASSTTVRRGADANMIDWEAAETPGNRPARASEVAAGSYFYGDNTGLAEDQALLDAAVARGVREIFEAHRRNIVQFTTPFHAAGGAAPDTSDTARVEYIDAAGRTNRAQGKVERVRHRFAFESNEAETTVTLALCRGGGAGVPAPTHDFVAPATDATLPPDSGTAGSTANEVAVHNQLGNDPASPPHDPDQPGYSGNYSVQYSTIDTPLGPVYPTYLELESDKISADKRDTVSFDLNVPVAVQLPQDLLELEA